MAAKIPVLAAANRSTVVTGGHCVHTMDLIGNNPQWTDKLLFVPGFRDNTRPYGEFVARAAFADTTWVTDDQQAAQPLGIGLPGTLPAQEFGYPRAAKAPGHQGRPEFTGNDEVPMPRGQWGVPCDMGGGASGGPRPDGVLREDRLRRGRRRRHRGLVPARRRLAVPRADAGLHALPVRAAVHDSGHPAAVPAGSRSVNVEP
ncbi:trypsin-like serine peptidase [Amycolatopsis sp. cmx-8-4]|uniref:trypsin-like serine peptidase n=1 Tax=Amycolatopsis sp. cmx-8-4 TaxID=2790947 RepID=UPI00397CBEF8